LADRVIKAENFIERAERHEQDDKAYPHDECRYHVGVHQRPLMMSATRSALAMIVNVGLTAPMEGKKLASVI
jgi:hypothetical protein